jgi:hypothetical protein
MAWIALCVPEDHGAEHHVLGKLVRLGLHHHHALLRSGNDQIELGLLELRGGRIDHVLPVDVAHAAGADRPVERHARKRQRRRHREHRRNVGIHFGIQRHHLRHHLHLIEEPIREQRTDRAVDQAGGQRFLLGRSPLALEETAGNLAGGVGALRVVDRQREEVLVRARFLRGSDGRQHDRVVDGAHHGALRLARDFTGFESDLVVAQLERFLDRIQWITSLGGRNTKTPIA